MYFQYSELAVAQHSNLIQVREPAPSSSAAHSPSPRHINPNQKRQDHTGVTQTTNLINTESNSPSTVTISNTTDIQKTLQEILGRQKGTFKFLISTIKM